MSSVKVMLVVFLFISAVWPESDLWKLECLPTVGIFAQTTVVKCFFKGITDIDIVAVSLRKADQNEPFFTQSDSKPSDHQRFSLENMAMGPSLQISDTHFSDDGKYVYRVVTDSGAKEIELSISVTAKYKDPVTSTWPEHVTDGGAVSLYCNTTDGYPEGFIHWFDRDGSDWTKNAELTKEPKDISGVKSVALSSKLPFKTINLALAPFTCIVFNSKHVQDGENTLRIKETIIDRPEGSSKSNTTNIVAGVMVIGSLTVGLLFALLCFRQRKLNNERRLSAHPIINYGPTSTNDLEKDDISP